MKDQLGITRLRPGPSGLAGVTNSANYDPTKANPFPNLPDPQGSSRATVAAGPVFRLLGAKDIGEKEDYRTAKMPPVNTSLLGGELAWRQHDGGHEDRSNMKHFIAWANKLLKHTPPSPEK